MGIIISNRDNQEFASTVGVKSTVAHNAYHMATDQKYYEPQRTNNFEFIVTGLEGLTKAYTLDEEGQKLGSNNTYSAQEAIRLSVNAANVPSFTQNAISVQRGNTTINYAGQPQFGSGSITINDYIGLEAREALYAWQALSFNVLTQKVGVAQDYKKICYLQEFTPDWQLVRTWKLFGCWISGIDDGSYSSSGSEVHTTTATIVYDYAIIDRD